MSPQRAVTHDLALYAAATVDALCGVHGGALPRAEVIAMLRGVGLADEEADAVLALAIDHGWLVPERAMIRAGARPLAA